VSASATFTQLDRATCVATPTAPRDPRQSLACPATRRRRRRRGSNSYKQFFDVTSQAKRSISARLLKVFALHNCRQL